MKNLIVLDYQKILQSSPLLPSTLPSALWELVNVYGHLNHLKIKKTHFLFVFHLQTGMFPCMA